MSSIYDVKVGDATYSYRYPQGKNWKPGSKLHKKIVAWITERVNLAHSTVAERFPAFRRVEDNLTGFVQLDEEEEKIIADDYRKPVSMVVPELYASLESLMTYLVTLHASETLFQLEPVGPEDEYGALLLEQELQRQNDSFENLLPLCHQWRSSFCYGYGVITPQWSRQWEWKRVKQPVYSMWDSSAAIGSDITREKFIACEGNKFVFIPPYCYFPDPNAPIEHPDEGEFISFVQRTNLPALLDEEDDPFSGLFNVRYLQHKDNRSKYYEDMTRAVNRVNSTTYYNQNNAQGNDNTKPVDLLFFVGAINPKKLGVGNYDGIEKWLFVLAGDDTIVYAEPLDLDHNRMPVAVAAPDADGVSTLPLSRMELVTPIQEFLSWMFSAIVAGKRESMRGRIAFDPSIFWERDVFNANPTHPIRVRRAHWGRGVKDGLQILNSPDVTGDMLMQAGIVSNMIQHGTGATDVVQGLRRRTSERVSAEEAQGTRESALSRLHTLALMISMQSMRRLGYMCAKQTQQYKETSGYVRTSGRLREYLINTYGSPNLPAPVGPEDILIDYDVMIKDPARPHSANVRTWEFIFQTVAANPVLAQTFDITRIFTHLARITGAPDVQSFVAGPSVPPVTVGTPEQMDRLQNAQASSNTVPFPGAAGALGIGTS